ncbi:MAG: amidohydrolase [Caldilineaceae bacterium]|nr:amidohydrolase [Caldilineaceae bacterium]MBP8110312.1 amidohydrolase [Caldilineaceae bacterium]
MQTPESTASELKQQVSAYIDGIADMLIQTSLTLHANPEIAFEEYESMALLADLAEEYGYAVQRGVAGLETAFLAQLEGGATDPDKGGPTIAFLAEYDALPGLGHACGHNIIGTAATGAALAMQSIRDRIPGTVQLIGTPAEENGGGKAIMVERGIFAHVDAAMMVHPGTKAMVARGSIASNTVTLEFFGKSAHAAAAPDAGINALDACIQTFNSINALRQHLPQDVRIHGIITHGGTAVNVVPEYAAARFSVRATESDFSFQVVDKVVACAEASAAAMGATVKVSHERHYANRIPNLVMARLFAENIGSLGENVQTPDANERRGSSDMGNVSQILPAIHPYVTIAPPGIGGHTPEFAAAAASPWGHQALIRSAKALAMTAVDLFIQPELLAEAKSEFARTVNPDPSWRKKKFFA